AALPERSQPRRDGGRLRRQPGRPALRAGRRAGNRGLHRRADRPVSVSAAIMAGGKSSRMGQDKAWIELDGEPLIKRVAAVLSEVADEVIVVANDPRYESLGLAVVRDRYPQGGPLGGIATAVATATHETVLVAACDMPF